MSEQLAILTYASTAASNRVLQFDVVGPAKNGGSIGGLPY